MLINDWSATEASSSVKECRENEDESDLQVVLMAKAIFHQMTKIR